MSPDPDFRLTSQGVFNHSADVAVAMQSSPTVPLDVVTKSSHEFNTDTERIVCRVHPAVELCVHLVEWGCDRCRYLLLTWSSVSRVLSVVWVLAFS